MMCERSTALGPIKIKVGKVTGCSEADHMRLRCNIEMARLEP